jgi:hypothetical protein
MQGDTDESDGRAFEESSLPGDYRATPSSDLPE